MRKIVLRSLILAALVISATPAQAALRIFACEPEWAALATVIGGDEVDVFSATTPQQDVHYIQARPSLIAKLRRADLAICTGADLEVGWLPVLLRQAANPDVRPGQPGFLEASRYANLLEVPTAVDRSMGDVHPYGNPHIQLDPRNIASVAGELLDRLKALDPENADAYTTRYDTFSERWSSKIEAWTLQAEPLQGMGVVVYHRSWVYLVDWLDLREVAAIEPKPGIPPSTGHLAKLTELIDAQDVDVIVRSAYQSAKASDWLSRRTGVPAAVLPQTVGAVAGADDLYSWYDTLINTLLEYQD